MIKRCLVLFFILAFTSFGFFANAQIRDTDIVLSISPQYPKPNQEVEATLNSHSINLDKANMSWSVNNQDMSIGIGKKSFSFKMDSLGSETVLSVTIETIDGQSILKTITLSGADVDMLWEATDAYTPPFYRGKTLVPSQGTFKVVAIPNLVNQSGKVGVSNLSYAWKKDGKAQVDSSGWGKNYLLLQNSYLDRENVAEVKVSDISGGTTASGKITLTTVNPKIVFYKYDSSLGVKWETALNNGFIINPNGETIVIEPYFFSPKNINSSDLTFDWFLSEEKIETPNPKNMLSIKPEAGQSGSALIKIVINNVNTLFQSMTKQISVEF